jgi:hypothetical protein
MKILLFAPPTVHQQRKLYQMLLYAPYYDAGISPIVACTAAGNENDSPQSHRQEGEEAKTQIVRALPASLVNAGLYGESTWRQNVSANKKLPQEFAPLSGREMI